MAKRVWLLAFREAALLSTGKFVGRRFPTTEGSDRPRPECARGGVAGFPTGFPACGESHAWNRNHGVAARSGRAVETASIEAGDDFGGGRRIGGGIRQSQGERLLPLSRFWSLKTALPGKSAGNLPQLPLQAYNRLLDLLCVGSRRNDPRAEITPLGFVGIAQR